MDMRIFLLFTVLSTVTFSSHAFFGRREPDRAELEYGDKLRECQNRNYTFSREEIREKWNQAVLNHTRSCQNPDVRRNGFENYCRLVREVMDCFSSRSRALPVQGQITPRPETPVPATPSTTANEAVVRLAGIHSACLTGASMESGFLVESRRFLLSFIQTNCQPTPRDANMRLSCESARTASQCVLNRIDGSGRVNNSDRESGKTFPSTDPGTRTGTIGANPQ